MAVAHSTVADLCLAAREASHSVVAVSAHARTRAILAMAERLEAPGAADALVAASEADAEDQRQAGASAFREPQLDARRVRALADYCREAAELPDPVADPIEVRELANGLRVEERRMPLGVVAWAFHGRPHTAIEAAAIALRAGNATVLKGTAPTRRANAQLAELASAAVESAGLPAATVTFVPATDDDSLRELATQHATVALLKQRGGHPLHRLLRGVASVPVVYAIEGCCHLYVHADADPELATAVAVDSKASRPGRCESIETMLVHEGALEGFLPRALSELHGRGVELRCDTRAIDAARAAGVPADAATDDDWAAEYQSPILAVGVVDSLDEAVEHVTRYGSGHAEAIATGSGETARAFTQRVDAAYVYVNASTRFSDGRGLGFGPDFGNSVQKLPVRGPIRVRDLTTRQFVVEGDGQVRG
ncbi:MAG TPA: glutamate-5-semialdehyde dehydrogenase [Thermoleophilaceae bacterium]|jgi:glutamate-5-semialdehyde dehydrogenase